MSFDAISDDIGSGAPLGCLVRHALGQRDFGCFATDAGAPIAEWLNVMRPILLVGCAVAAILVVGFAIRSLFSR